MTFVMVSPDIAMTMRTEIVIWARRALIANAEDGFVTSITEDMRMKSAVNIGTHTRLSRMMTTRMMGSPHRCLNRLKSNCINRTSQLSDGWRMLLNLDFDISIRNADFDHRMRRNVSMRTSRLELLKRFATLAKIEIGTESALESNAADTSLDTLASSTIAMDMTMLIWWSGDETFEHRREMFVDWSKCVARMD